VIPIFFPNRPRTAQVSENRRHRSESRSAEYKARPPIGVARESVPVSPCYTGFWSSIGNPRASLSVRLLFIARPTAEEVPRASSASLSRRPYSSAPFFSLRPRRFLRAHTSPRGSVGLIIPKGTSCTSDHPPTGYLIQSLQLHLGTLASHAFVATRLLSTATFAMPAAAAASALVPCNQPNALYIFLFVPIIYFGFFLLARFANARSQVAATSSTSPYRLVAGPAGVQRYRRVGSYGDLTSEKRALITQPSVAALEREKTNSSKNGHSSPDSHHVNASAGNTPCRCRVCRVRSLAGVHGDWHCTRPPVSDEKSGRSSPGRLLQTAKPGLS
jgi:hypothetical protein